MLHAFIKMAKIANKKENTFFIDVSYIREHMDVSLKSSY